MGTVVKGTEIKQTDGRFIPIKERYPMIAKIMEAEQMESQWSGTPFDHDSDPDHEVLRNGAEQLIERILTQQYVIIDVKSKERTNMTITPDWLWGMRESINELVEMLEGCEVIAQDYAFMQGFIACARLRNETFDGICEAQPK